MNVYNLPISISSSTYCLNGTAVLSLIIRADDRKRMRTVTTYKLPPVLPSKLFTRFRKNNLFSMKFIETYVGFGDCAGVNKI